MDDEEREMFVPKLGEEEARYFLLCCLSQSSKGQGRIEDIRRFILSSRKAFGEADRRPNPTRSNAPFWYQIAQNASDRVIAKRGYVIEVEPPPNKTIKITDEGRNCIQPYVEYFRKHSEIETFTFFDNDLLSDFYNTNANLMKKWRFYRNAQFFEFIKSKSYAMAIFPDFEEKKFSDLVLDGLEKKYSQMEFADASEKTFRLAQINAWRYGRNSFPKYDVMCGKLT